MLDQFSRTELLLGKAALEKLKNSRVAVFGVGGVGGYVVEALVRSGIGAIDIIDNDRVALTNLNRQIIATRDSIGRSKVEVMRERVLSINPDCAVTAHEMFFLPETADRLDFSKFDYVVDAIDTVTAKLELIARSKAAGVPIICSMGTGNKLDPTMLEVCDIAKTSVCPLARVMRLECRKRGFKNIKTVYSRENPVSPEPALLRKCMEEEGAVKPIPASASFVPPAAGLIIASEVVRDLCGIKK